jgi:hypothetical protein
MVLVVVEGPESCLRMHLSIFERCDTSLDVTNEKPVLSVEGVGLYGCHLASGGCLNLGEDKGVILAFSCLEPP